MATEHKKEIKPVVVIKENKWVRRFYRSQEQSMVAIGAKGSGKTTVAAHWALREACKVQPGEQGLITFNTLQQARDAYKEFIKPLLEELNIPFSYNEQQLNLSLPNGSVVHLRSAEKDVVKRVETLQYAWWWGDECQDYSSSALKTFKSRVRKGMARMRITSMPADPDDMIYKFAERMGCTVYELSLYDNPDKEFVEFYEQILKEIYTEEELKRYRDGERVTLAGRGLFAADRSHIKQAEYNPSIELVLIWDFNAEYRAVTAWQPVENKQGIPVYNCIESFQLKKWTTKADAEELCQHYRDHAATIVLNGDATGDNRTAAASDSMWLQVKKAFEGFFPDVKYQVPKANPNVKDTIQVTNWALTKHLIQFSNESRIAYRYLVAAKSDKHGEIDKSRDSEDDSPKSHEVDTIRYFAYHKYWRHFPGRRQQKATSTKMKGF